MLKFEMNVSPQTMESSYANATLQNAGDVEVNIAVYLPEGMEFPTQVDAMLFLREKFTRLGDEGFTIDIQLGDREEER